MAKRINVILPEDTACANDGMDLPGQRGQFIHRSERSDAAAGSSETFDARLKAAALRDRDLDLEVTLDWSAMDVGDPD